MSRKPLGVGRASLRHRLVVGVALLASFGVGGCTPSAIDLPSSVSFDGQVYQFQRPGRYLTLESSDLSEIGEATRISHEYIDSITVYAIQGVDSGSAVAMRSTPGASDDLGPIGEFLVLYAGAYPSELCRYERADVAQPAEDC